MAANLSQRSTNGYDYVEVIGDGENGESVLIPNDLVGSLTCTIVAGANTGKVQFSTSTEEAVLTDVAVWQDWPQGTVTGTTYDVLVGPVSSVRGVSVSGEITIEVIG